MKEKILFNEIDVTSLIEDQKVALKKKILSLDSNFVLTASEDEIVNWIVDEFRFEVPEILDDEMYIEGHNETQVDISQDRTRLFRDRSQPFYVSGSETVIAIPFDGDSSYFDISPTKWSSGGNPSAKVTENLLLLTYSQADANGDAIKNAYTKTVEEIKQRLGWLAENFHQSNDALEGLVKKIVSGRKTKILDSKGMVESLGLPIKKRDNAPTTYSIPVSRKKIKIKKPKADQTPFRPEPTIAEAEYDHILSIIENMVLVMEKSPKAFENMDEEALRTHFLVQLNGEYEGRATGETFNFEGKTDILISEKGRNVFIAECKFWGGEKSYLKTIDQLLGYLSWRDTKTAIIIFSRNKKFSSVLESISKSTKKHPCFLKEMGKSNESTFRFRFKRSDDSGQQLLLTVKAFSIPSL